MTVADHRDANAKRPHVLAEIWTGFRPYLVRFAIDFLISAFLWVALYLFKVLTTWLAIGGWAGEFMHIAHAAGIVSAAVVFAALFVLDIYSLHLPSHG